MMRITRLRSKHFFLVVMSVIVLRALDLYITYRYTPGLAAEWNPVVSLFGAGWTGLIIVQVLLIFIISVAMFFYFMREEKTVAQADLSFQDFVYVYFFDKLRPWPERMFTFPYNFRTHMVFLGFILMVLAVFISIFAILHNVLLIAQIKWYCLFVGQHYKVYFPVVFGMATIIAALIFFMKEFGKYKRPGVLPAG
jgi:hypothetical protein